MRLFDVIEMSKDIVKKEDEQTPWYGLQEINNRDIIHPMPVKLALDKLPVDIRKEEFSITKSPRSGRAIQDIAHVSLTRFTGAVIVSTSRQVRSRRERDSHSPD